ncbi:MAG: YaiI/YqxD family protein [Alcaligenes sp.]
MQIWVDADACPVVIKEILYRAGQRWSRHVTLVANQMLRTPPSPWLRAVQVARGFDVADDYIVQHASPGDLVITADIPLAAQVLERGALVLTPRGERLDANSIGERLAIRDMMDELRSTGVDTGGPPPFSQADRREFANALDRLMASLKIVARS